MMGLPSKRQAKHYGLMNQGATCYLNSVLQVLFMTDSFRERVKSYYHSSARTDRIDRELIDLFTHLEEGCTHTDKITDRLMIKNVYEQRDAAELYEKILRLTSPEASKVFHGELINRSTCQECQKAAENVAGFWHLPLPLVINNNEYSVEKGIKDFFSPSVISGDDQMYCEKCDKKCNAILECEVKHYPEVLVLLLKRFDMIFDGNIIRKVKNNCPVKMLDTLLMEKTYKLYAFVEHFGELQFGHYNAKIKSPDKGLWYIFDDLNVEESSYQHFQLDPTETSKHVYLLFYRQQKGDASLTNIARPDTRETPLATATIGTIYTHCSTEEHEKGDNNTTEDISAFSEDYGANSAGPASKRGTTSEERRPKASNLDFPFPQYSNGEQNELKSVKHKVNNKHEPSQDVDLRDISNNSMFRDHINAVIDIPADTREETTESHKRQRQAFDQIDYHEKWKKRHVKIRKISGSYGDFDDFKNAHSSRLPQSNKQYRKQYNLQMRQPSKPAEYQPGPVSPVTNKTDWRLPSQQTDLNLRVARQNSFNFSPPAGSHSAIMRSSSFAPGQSSRQMHRNMAGHYNMTQSGEGLRSLESFSVKSDRGTWNNQTPGSGVTGYKMGTGRDSFHAAQRQYRSQTYHLENFRSEMERSDRQTDKQRRGSQNDSYKTRVGRQSQGEAPYSQEKPQLHPTPQQCLARSLQVTQKPKTRLDDSYSMGRVEGNTNHKSKEKKIPNYSPQNDRSVRNHYEAEIMPDNFNGDVNSATLDNTQETRGCQTSNEDSDVVLDTNDGKTKKRRGWRMFFCGLVPFKKKRPK